MNRKFVVSLLAVSTLLCSTACAPMLGVSSLTLVSSDNAVDSRFTPVGGNAEASDCFNWAILLFMWGDFAPTHEGVVARMLEEHDADAVLDARVTSSQFGIPYIFMRTCTKVSGTPARLAKGGN